MKLDPKWVAGFVDGEGTFYVGINKNPTMRTGYQVLPEFRIVQHKKDVRLLYGLKKFFGTGVVRVNHDDRYEIRIRNLDKLATVVVPMFRKHQLLTQKRFDFIRFAKIIDLMRSDAHLELEGILKIIDIASQMNRADKIRALEIKKEIENRIVI